MNQGIRRMKQNLKVIVLAAAPSWSVAQSGTQSGDPLIVSRTVAVVDTDSGKIQQGPPASR
jgi:hypothetical protein